MTQNTILLHIQLPMKQNAMRKTTMQAGIQNYSCDNSYIPWHCQVLIHFQFPDNQVSTEVYNSVPQVGIHLLRPASVVAEYINSTAHILYL